MTYSSSDRTRTNPVSDKDIIVDQEVRYADGSVQKHREKLSSNDPAAEARIERARLEMDRQLKIRDNDNAARGLLVGVIATTFLGLGILAWYILTHQQETEVNPVVVPAQPAEPSTPPDINITLPNPRQPKPLKPHLPHRPSFKPSLLPLSSPRCQLLLAAKRLPRLAQKPLHQNLRILQLPTSQ